MIITKVAPKVNPVTGYRTKPRLDPRGVMEIAVVRQPTKDGATLGRMTVDGGWICYTLENPVREMEGQPVSTWKVLNHTAIGRGRYPVQIAWSDHFKCEMPHVLGVDGFTGILIHWGNVPKDTDGCILVGFTIVNAADIGSSRAAFFELFGQIQEAIKAGQQVWLTVA